MAVLLKPRQLNVSAIKSKNGVLTIALATAVLTLLVSLFLGFGGFGPKWDQPFNASFDGNQYEVTFSDTFSRNDPYATGEGYHFFVARCYYANLGPRSRGLSWTDVDAELRTKTGHLYTSCGDDGSPYVEIIGSTVPLGFKFRIPNNEEPHSIILHKFGDKEIVIPTIKPPPAQKSRSSLTAAEIMRESQMRR
jgi:hypothetical protein